MNKKLNKIFIGFAIVSCIGLSACKKKMPNNVLSKGDMEEVLVDYHIAKTMSEMLPYEEHYKQVLYMDYVFKKHGITENDFNVSLEWYSRHAEDFAKIYENVNKRLNSQKDDINHQIASTENGSQESEQGDSVNVWKKQKIYRLTKSTFTKKMSFTIYPDSNYKEKDFLIWSLRATFVSAKKHNQNAIMSLQIKYTNDSVLINTRKISNNGDYKIRLQNDSLCKIREISGFVYYNNNDSFNEDMLILDKISLMRYRTKDNRTNSQRRMNTVTSSSNTLLMKDSTKELSEKPIKIDSAAKVGDVRSVMNVNSSSAIPRRRSTQKVNRLEKTQILQNDRVKK